MQVKINTKEKFTVITPITPHLTANLADELIADSKNVLLQEVKNVILNLQAITAIDAEAANKIVLVQQSFYEQNASFVVCELKQMVEDYLEELELLELLNATPTESEAWDIVQMEEIERELLDGL